MAEGGGRSAPGDGTDRSLNPSSLKNDSIDDDSAFYAFGDEWDLPPPMSGDFATFLHQKAGVPMQFISEFEQAALVWDLESFMRWFSLGSTYDVAT
jgi:hypothetical protein